MRNTAGTKQGQEALSQAGAAATEMADSASKQVTTFASEITTMTLDNPMGALAAATMFGVLILVWCFAAVQTRGSERPAAGVHEAQAGQGKL
jgi:hypothetical protein